METTTLLIIAIVVVVVVIVLFILGKKAQKRQAEQQEQMEAMKQTVSMLIIDKKRMKIKEAGLPAAVLENTPKYLRGSKVPVVKAKVGPKIMTLMCDEKYFIPIMSKLQEKKYILFSRQLKIIILMRV